MRAVILARDRRQPQQAVRAPARRRCCCALHLRQLALHLCEFHLSLAVLLGEALLQGMDELPVAISARLGRLHLVPQLRQLTSAKLRQLLLQRRRTGLHIRSAECLRARLVSAAASLRPCLLLLLSCRSGLCGSLCSCLQTPGLRSSKSAVHARELELQRMLTALQSLHRTTLLLVAQGRCSPKLITMGFGSNDTCLQFRLYFSGCIQLTPGQVEVLLQAA
mmetsp:Transcript_57271/g.178001  ORF Transcript_57271/g.178001 Transcript_57271/m.178001 type:complete len:221 (-) Transcript_57271:842-1504(-)